MALRRVRTGGGEGPFAGCLGQAADAQAADALVVLDVAVEGLAEVAAPAVGGDAVFGGQAGRHRRDRRVLGFPRVSPGPARARAGGFSPGTVACRSRGAGPVPRR